MADKNIGSLDAATSFDDDSLLLVEQQGAAKSVLGRLIKDFVISKIKPYMDNAVSAAADAIAAAAQALSSQKAAASSAGNAAASKTASKASETAAGKSATEAQSWAVGGTGTRAGENTNNAKYWSTVAMGAAGGGVTTFNGRFGAVVPQTGDYTPSMVGAAPESLIDRVRLMEYMMTHNAYVAPLATDDTDLTVLVDDNNNAILADWHYKEV